MERDARGENVTYLFGSKYTPKCLLGTPVQCLVQCSHESSLLTSEEECYAMKIVNYVLPIQYVLIVVGTRYNRISE